MLPSSAVLGRVEHSVSPLPGVSYLAKQDGVYVSDNVFTNLNFPLMAGYYTVYPLTQTFDGESLDLSFYMAGSGIPGVFSADIDGIRLEPVVGRARKLALLRETGKELSLGYFAD